MTDQASKLLHNQPSIIEMPDGLLALVMGRMLDHKEAAEVIERLQEFYRTHTPEEIAAINSVEEIRGFVYLMRRSNGQYKIGRSLNVENRQQELQRKYSDSIEIIHVIPCDDYVSAEIEMHERFAHRQVRGEWFSLTADDVEQIKSLDTL